MMRTRDRTAPPDRGATLAELAVAMAVFGLLATLLATTVVQGTRLARVSAVRESSAQRASLLVEQITKDLRTAVRVGATAVDQKAFAKADLHEVVFFSSVEPKVLQERLAVSGTRVVRETWTPLAGTVYPTLGFPDWTTVPGHSAPLVPPDMPATVTFGYVLGTAAPVGSTTDLQAITAVTVHVEVDGDGPGGQKPVVLESTVRPYNR